MKFCEGYTPLHSLMFILDEGVNIIHSRVLRNIPIYESFDQLC